MPHLVVVRAFVEAVRERWPRAIIQWEDFGKESAFDVLEAFRGVLPSFNDRDHGHATGSTTKSMSGAVLPLTRTA